MASLSALALLAPSAARAQLQDMPAPVAAAPPLVLPTLADQPLRPLSREVDPYATDVSIFWGDINPFYGKVRAFWGDVDPFYGKVRAFWGDLDPTGITDADVGPRYAKIGPFWNRMGRRWNRIADVWSSAGAYDRGSMRDYRWVSRQLKEMFATARATWKRSVLEQTGASTFEQGFRDPFLARYGVSLDDPTSLAQLDAAMQSRFFIEFYDGLMAFSGTDHADWWMKTINWTPQLTQTMGSGTGSTLGLVDDYATKSTDIQTRVKDLTKKSGSAGGHGEGVLSLIVAAHDGKGVMGIAPGADVIAYNPFTNGGAEWTDVSNGIQAVASKGATVINLSLGAPGVTLSPEWQKIFTKSEINTHKDKTLYIIAAGNDGASQSGIVDMKGALDTTFIVVGSIGPDGAISDFSNRPGTACLTDGGSECKGSSSLKESGYLMNRFIVAPGELILVSDGNGGLVRQSGTSLAAPLVAGAVALIQDRWPWMREKPRDIAMVILGSAKDLGAPGIDPVYGVGMLDVEGAMSPLDFGKLKYLLTSKDGRSQNEVSVDTLRRGGIQASWATNDMYFTAFEKLDQVERDFLIPLSSRLYGQTRNKEYFQSFVYDRMVSWLGTTGFASGRAGFVDGARGGTVEAGGGWTMRMSGRVLGGYSGDAQVRRALLRSTISMASPSGGLGFSFGSGDGAVALGGGADLSLASDFDPYSGGANPLLGFASGGAHMAAQVVLSPAVSIRAGFTEQRRALGYDIADGLAIGDPTATRPGGRYQSSAAAMHLDYQPLGWMRLSASVTSLREPNAFLGVRPLVGNDLAGGTATQGVTLGAHAALGSGLTVFGTGTMARGSSADRTGSLRIGPEGVTGASFQSGIAKQGLLGRLDALRLTLAQPLRFTGGAIELTEVQVVDRQTGEKGVVTQRFAIGDAQPRRLVVEGHYAAPFLEGRGQIGLFGRGELRDLDAGAPRLMLGSQVQFGF